MDGTPRIVTIDDMKNSGLYCEHAHDKNHWGESRGQPANPGLSGVENGR